MEKKESSNVFAESLCIKNIFWARKSETQEVDNMETKLEAKEMVKRVLEEMMVDEEGVFKGASKDEGEWILYEGADDKGCGYRRFEGVPGTKVGENFDDLMRFYRFPYGVRRFTYTTNQLERLFKEVKRRLKVIEMLPEEENADKILFLIFYELNERISKGKPSGFELVF